MSRRYVCKACDTYVPQAPESERTPAVSYGLCQKCFDQKEEGDMRLTKLRNLFTYHAPKGDQQERYQALREQGLILATMVETHCPDGDEKALAITKLREAIMWANAAIACNE